MSVKDTILICKNNCPRLDSALHDLILLRLQKIAHNVQYVKQCINDIYLRSILVTELLIHQKKNILSLQQIAHNVHHM